MQRQAHMAETLLASFQGSSSEYQHWYSSLSALGVLHWQVKRIKSGIQQYFDPQGSWCQSMRNEFSDSEGWMSVLLVNILLANWSAFAYLFTQVSKHVKIRIQVGKSSLLHSFLLLSTVGQFKLHHLCLYICKTFPDKFPSAFHPSGFLRL